MREEGRGVTTATDELINEGRCPCCGQPRWRLRMCTCGHSVVDHGFAARSVIRGKCTVLTPGPCDCRKYTEAGSHG